MRLAHDPPAIVLHTESDVLDVIPSLLGFHPGDSLVVLLVTPESGVLLTARVDLAACLALPDPSEPLAGALRRIGHRPGLGAIVVGYGSERGELCGAVSAMVGALPALEVFGAVVVDGRWWFHDDGPHDPGRPYDPRSSAIEAAAVYAGQPVLGSRDEVVARLVPADGRRPRGVTRAFREAHRAVRVIPAEAEGAAMRDLLDAYGTGAGRVPDLARLARLAMLARRPGAREEFWRRLDRDTAPGFVELWRHVVRVAPRRWSVPAWCLLGMSAWQAGEAVLLSTSLDRATAISPRHELVKVLAAVSFHMLPPHVWHRMRGEPDLVPA